MLREETNYADTIVHQAWFMHCDELKKADFSGVNCNICWKTFQNINHFFHHKKSEHTVLQLKSAKLGK